MMMMMTTTMMMMTMMMSTFIFDGRATHLNHGNHLPAIFHRKIHASTAPKQHPGISSRHAHCRRVHVRRHFLEIIHKQVVEQRLVAVLQRRQEEKLGYRVLLVARALISLRGLAGHVEAIIDSLHLLVNTKHARRNQSTNAEAIALRQVEARSCAPCLMSPLGITSDRTTHPC
jgi:hypothetical protein